MNNARVQLRFGLMLAVLIAFGVIAHSAFSVTPPKPVPKPNGAPRPLVSFTFDDGKQSYFDHALPILNAAKVPSTQYYITQYLVHPDPAFMTLDELRIVQAQGHEIGSHSVHHKPLSNLPLDVMRHEIIDSRQQLMQAGLRVTTFAYPGGDFGDPNTINTPITQALKDGGYIAARGTTYRYTDFKNSNRVRLGGEVVTKTTTVADIQHWMDVAVQNKQWLDLVFHGIDEQQPTQYDVGSDVLKGAVDYAKKIGLQVVTVDQGMRIWRPGLYQ